MRGYLVHKQMEATLIEFFEDLKMTLMENA
jgi:hypothetical protein